MRPALHEPTVRWLDMFAGAGGFSLGLERVPGHKIVACSETDPHAAAVHAHHFPRCQNLGDARAVDPYSIPGFDAVAAGFPCQPFSHAGLREGFADTRGTLVHEVLRIVKHRRPRLVLLENVPGLLSHDGGRTFGTILQALDELRYDAGWQVLDGAHFLPQSRARLFIAAAPRLLAGGRPLLPVSPRAYLAAGPRPEAPPPEPRLWPAGNHAAAAAGILAASTLDATYQKGGGTRQHVAELIPSPSSVYRVYDASEAALARTLRTPSGGHTATGLYAVHTRQYRTRSGPVPLHSDRRSVSITTNPSAGILEFNDGAARYAIRRLTPTECERLQGFPVGYTAVADAADTHRYRMLGNAVMVPVAQALGRLVSDWWDATYH